MKRIYCELPAPAPSTVTLSGAPFHHLVTVLRAQVSETIEVFDGQGRTYTSVVSSVEASVATISLGSCREAPPLRRLYVVQGLPKGDKLETVFQKCTELGAAGFFPAAMSRCVVQIAPEKAEHKTKRWQKIVEEAARQCGRADVPTVAAPAPLLQTVKALPPECLLLLLDEEEQSLRLKSAFSRAQPQQPVALIIGPEGGLGADERAQLLKFNALPVSLGPRILRTETAPVAALSVLLHLDGALG